MHLRPYDKEKYEKPIANIKLTTGYALFEVDPMPRARIMKICYNILDKVKQVPAHVLYRIYTEEKIKYIMKITDETEDIRKLEEEFGMDSIEVFIWSLAKELNLVDYMMDSKPWEMVDDEDAEFMKLLKVRSKDLKHME